MFNQPLSPDRRLFSTGDPYAANVVLYLPMTDAIAVSPYNGQAIPAGGNLNDYGVNSLGASYTPSDAKLLTATGSNTGGSLAANTYYVRVIAYNSSTNALINGGTTTEVGTIITGSTGSIALSWPSMSASAYYRVFFWHHSG